MNYITLVDEIIKETRNKILNAPFNNVEDFNNTIDYLVKKTNSLIKDVKQELEMEFQD